MKNKRDWFFLCILAFFCLIPEITIAQTLHVEGAVLDESNETLIGVSVRIKGTNTGTITNYEGRYLLQNVPQGSTLVFSYIGYKDMEAQVTGGTLNVTMEPDNQQLEEVVVIGYGQQKKVTITGAVSNVGGKELLKSPAASLGNSLAGKLPGLQSVQYSGIPGGDDPVIRVRGIGSLNSAEPLVLVDGVERPFSQLDPHEVADISILKDASATAVFGVRGANGVILVTTRRGESGKPSVSFSAQGGIQQITRFLTPANSYEYATAYNTAQMMDGVAKENWKYSDEAIQHFRDRDMLMVYPDTNWFDYLMKNHAWQSQYNVNISGGSDKARYFVSVGMLDQDGLFKTFGQGSEANFKYRRYNYRANMDLTLSRLSQLSVNVGGRLETRNSIGGGEGGSGSGGQGGLFANEGLLNSGMPMSGYGLDSEGRRIVADRNLVGDYTVDALGRLYQLGYTKQSKNTVNLDLQYQLKLDFITKGLDFKVKGSYNASYTAEKNREHGYGSGIKYRATLAPGEFEEDGSPKIVLVKEGDSWPLPYGESKWGDRNWYAEASFNYARKFGNHNVGALVLYNQSKRYYPWDSQGLYTSIPSGYVGTVGRITYNYATRYLVDMNMGYNGSENFAKGRRYGFFPSASIGWIPSSEAFWEPVSTLIPYLKLRVSIGRVGNDNTNNLRFLYLPGSYEYFQGGNGGGYIANRTANFGTDNNNWMPGAREASAGNPFVTWETATKQNYGVDLKLINSKLSFSADFFFEDRKNILVSNETSLAAITGMSASSVNFGRVKNRGYELSLRWDDRIGNVSYSIAPGLSFARNKVIEMAEVKQDYDYLYRTGLPVGQPFGREFFELYEPGKTEERYLAKYGTEMPDRGVVIQAGDCVYVDLNGDGKIDANDQHAIGFTDIPEYTGSLNISLSYKNIDFSMTWIGATNVDRQLGAYYRPAFGTGNTSMLNKWIYDNSWTEETAATARLPRLTFVNTNHNTELSRVWMVDASYVRLKNAEIGYTFKIPGVPQISNVRIYASGYNLLTFSKFKANDPESRGGEWGEFIKYPMTRVYNFGINVNF
ncbi:MAG: TonB-dependent receptor [Bacteroides sp.]|nr:TonB-dependent receptor [Bacteroides sp.]